MKNYFKQMNKEACYALLLTIMYLIGWIITAYLPDNKPGWTGLPLWFEFSCLLLPLVFIGLCGLMVRFFFRDIPLE